jgi:hypothetical protein
MSKVIKSYKGFNKDMTCRGFQYKEGKEYETSRAVVCNEGFHACEHPLDCLGYYPPNTSVYHEVEQTGEFSSDSGSRDSKIASTKIKIGAKLSIAGLVQAAIDFTKSKTVIMQDATGDYGASSATGYKGASSATGYKGVSSATGDYGASSATGYKGASSATGYKGVSSATGNCGASSATGNYGASSATGNCGASSATGDYGASSATGYKGVSSATGNYGASSATGNYGASSATGNYGASSATGNYGASSATGDCGASSATGYKGASSADNSTAVAVAWGYESKAKGCIGAHIVCAEWKYDNLNNDWFFVGAKMSIVDGVKIKADTYYTLRDGEFVEVKE